MLVQHDGEDLFVQRRRTVTGGAITGLSSVLEMTVDVLQQLRPQPGMRCLELGTGTDMAAGLLRRLVGADGAVVSVESDPHLALAAARRLAAAGQDVEVVTGDGVVGWPQGGPYDRIVATFAVPRLPMAWLDQLADDGVLWTNLATSSPSWPGTVVARCRSNRIEATLSGARSGHRPVAGFDWLNLHGYRQLREHVPGGPAGTVPAVPGVEEQGFWLAVSHFMPGVVQNSDAEDLTLVAPQDGSWAVFRPGGSGRCDVEAGGASTLWTGIEQIRRRWVRAGHPDAYRLTIQQDGAQYVHSGQEADELVWRLPDRILDAVPVEGTL